MIRFSGFLLLICLTACATQEQTATNPDSTQIIPAATSTPVQTGPLSSTLNAYYNLKDAFVKTDGTSADMTAMQLRLSVDSLNTQKLGVDSTQYAQGIDGYKKAMLATIDTLIKERDIQKKRRQFASLSDNLYNLAKTVPYSGPAIYRIHCPMAFDTGANWLNNQAVVNNPYFGSKMMECGEVTDSLEGK